MTVKQVWLDSFTRKGVAIVSVTYTLGLLIAIIIGAAGPEAMRSTQTSQELACGQPTSCNVTITRIEGGLSPFNQLLYGELALQRPRDSDNALVLINADYTTRVVYSLHLDVIREGKGWQPFAAPSTHVGIVHCGQGRELCDPFILFYEGEIDFEHIKVSVTLMNPLAQWAADSGKSLRPVVGYTLAVGMIHEGYTVFQLGWRYFFLTASTLSAIFHIYMMFFSRFSKDDAGNRLTTAMEQRWVAALSILLIFFNDPLFAYNVTNPVFPASAFSAFCTVTFVTALLTYWMVHFHIAALQSESGTLWELDQDGMNNLGLVFWVPKIVLATAFWIATFSLYLWVRYQQLSDPSYSIFESVPVIGDYFLGFAYTLGAIYFLYLFACIVLGCRYMKRMRLSNRMFMIITLATIIIIAIGMFANAFSPARTTSITFLVVYAAANFYVWLLEFTFLPSKKIVHSQRDLDSNAPNTSIPQSHLELDVEIDDVMVTADNAKASNRSRGTNQVDATFAESLAHPRKAGSDAITQQVENAFVVAEDDAEGSPADAERGKHV